MMKRNVVTITIRPAVLAIAVAILGFTFSETMSALLKMQMKKLEDL